VEKFFWGLLMIAGVIPYGNFVFGAGPLVAQRGYVMWGFTGAGIFFKCGYVILAFEGIASKFMGTGGSSGSMFYF
jgi:hypothetical protein